MSVQRVLPRFYREEEKMSVSIDIDHVVKRYGDNTVVKGLSLHVKPGEFLHCWAIGLRQDDITSYDYRIQFH